MEIKIPAYGILELQWLVCDYNGTLAFKGWNDRLMLKKAGLAGPQPKPLVYCSIVKGLSPPCAAEVADNSDARELAK